MIDESDHAPTKGAQEVFEQLRGQVAEVQGRLQSLLAEEVGRFDGLIREAGLPAIIA
jgi:hypothetical protein